MLAASLIIFPALCKLLDLSVPTSNCTMENLKPMKKTCSLHWLATLEINTAELVLYVTVTVREKKHNKLTSGLHLTTHTTSIHTETCLLAIWPCLNNTPTCKFKYYNVYHNGKIMDPPVFYLKQHGTMEITTFHPLDYSLGRTCDYKSRQNTKGNKNHATHCATNTTLC